MEKLNTVIGKKIERERSRIDCGSDHQLLIAKFKFKVKKVGKDTRPFRNNLNQNLKIIR